MGLIQSLISRAKSIASGRGSAASIDENLQLPNEWRPSTEAGSRATPEDEIKYIYRQMWVDPDTRRTILDIRRMDVEDPRVKRIHSRVARDTIRGGLVMQLPSPNDTIERAWDAFSRRLQLGQAAKLKSDARGLITEGNLPLQWVLDDTLTNVISAVRMPSETILPNVMTNGQFKSATEAYYQIDVNSGQRRDVFPLWQLLLVRFDPNNYDDMGSMGRPFLDSSRTAWRKLQMTEQDLVVRRRTRAPLRLNHILEGATKEDLEDYRAKVERDQASVTTDYYSSKKGGVTAIQGDSSLGEINDVVYLLDALFSGSPVPKGLMGYTQGMARDILQDLKTDYYDEVDVLQETLAHGYEEGFRLQLLLQGINPDAEDFCIRFSERRTETANQTVDRGLKLKALGLPQSMVWEELGYNAETVRKRAESDAKNENPYPGTVAPPVDFTAPGGGAPNPAQKVSITPGNAPKNESATSITND